jgi:hypothetical protein
LKPVPLYTGKQLFTMLLSLLTQHKVPNFPTPQSIQSTATAAAAAATKGVDDTAASQVIN